MHKLSGFLIIGDAPSFLVPTFTRSKSNHLYVQELSPDSKINRFLQVESGAYRQLDFLPPPEPREVGDAGLLAFVRQTGAVTYGELPEVVQRLRSSDPIAEGCGFFALEAALLLQDERLLERAIAAASRDITSVKLRSLWSSVELEMFHDEPLAEDSTRTRATDSSEEPWLQQWMRRWETEGPTAELVNSALIFIRANPRSYRVAGTLFAEILDTDLAHKNTFIRRLHSWIRLKDAMMLAPQTWAINWLRAEERGIISRYDSLQYGESFLSHHANSDKVPAVWTDVLSITMDRTKEFSAISTLKSLYRYSNAVLENSKVRRSVKTELVNGHIRRGTTDGLDVLDRWTTESPEFSNAWAIGMTHVLAIRGFGKHRQDVVRNWLEKEPGRLWRWWPLYELYVRRYGSNHSLSLLLSSWISRADPKLRTFVDAALAAASSEMSLAAEKAIERWLAQGGAQAHPAKREQLREYLRI